jgi:hypothetical protein
LDGVFSRVRVLTIKRLIAILLNFKSSIQRELDRFFKDLTGSDFNIRSVTKGAFTQARAKLNPWAFKRLNEVAVDFFYKNTSYQIWFGMRILAVDGSRLILPKHKTTKEEFGEHNFGPKADSPRSMAMCSLLYDVLNQVTIDSQLAPYADSERDLLLAHLDYVKKGDLLLLDRGYPCFWLFFLLQAKGIESCVRLKSNGWKEVENFVASNENQRIVSFNLPKKDKDKLKEYPQIQDIAISCRLIKVELETGETEILCTSLLDQEQYEIEQFQALYHCRWGEEEVYKLLKSRMELECFSGKTARAVKQDFYAKVFTMSLTAIYLHPVEKKVIAEYKVDEDRKHAQKTNRTSAIAFIQDSCIPIFLKNLIEKGIAAFDALIYKTREIIRPNRKNDRKHRPKKPYTMNYKKM